jgi:hypothetical protein
MLIAAETEGARSGSLDLAPEFPNPRATKRRRLNGDRDANSWEGEALGSGDDSADSAELASRKRTLQDVEHNRGPPNDKPKSKYRIHIPKYAGYPPDTFYTQLPTSSQNSHLIRGPYWQKPTPESQQEYQPLTSEASSVSRAAPYNAASRGQSSVTGSTPKPKTTLGTNHAQLQARVGSSGSAAFAAFAGSPPDEVPSDFGPREVYIDILLGCVSAEHAVAYEQAQANGTSFKFTTDNSVRRPFSS